MSHGASIPIERLLVDMTCEKVISCLSCCAYYMSTLISFYFFRQRNAAKAYDAHRVKCGKGQAVNVPEEFDPNADQLRLVDAEETISEEEPKDTRQLRYMKEWMTRNFDSNGKFWPEIIVPPPPVGTHDASLVRSDGKTTHNLW